MKKRVSKKNACVAALCLLAGSAFVHADNTLPIADAHVHYSHDSVELTPPERVIELMREAKLKFALVSSSDDTGTQLLAELAPELVIPGLRPYRQRGELNTWYTDPAALEYVEQRLSRHSYASIGEFHLFGENAELDIPKRIVELADEYNLVLHAHSDEEAIERLLAQSDTVKVLWAHSGFDDPEAIAAMLEKHDRLWADLAFRSEVGSGGSLSEDWIELFTRFPDRLMLGTDTYTPERIHFIPSHAESARVWLSSLPQEIAEKVAWKNAHNLLMPIWEQNRNAMTDNAASTDASICSQGATDNDIILDQGDLVIRVRTPGQMNVSTPFSVELTLCTNNSDDFDIVLDATMPMHGHGMNYTPERQVISKSENDQTVRFDGMLLHMPGKWQWHIELNRNGERKTLTHDFMLQ